LLLRLQVRMELRGRESEGRGPHDGPDRHGEREAVRDHVHGRGGEGAASVHPPPVPERRDRAGDVWAAGEGRVRPGGGGAADVPPRGPRDNPPGDRGPAVPPATAPATPQPTPDLPRLRWQDRNPYMVRPPRRPGHGGEGAHRTGPELPTGEAGRPSPRDGR